MWGSGRAFESVDIWCWSVLACSRAGGVLGLGLLHCLVAADQCNETGLKGAMRITFSGFRACV